MHPQDLCMEAGIQSKKCIERELWVGPWGIQSRSFIIVATDHPTETVHHWNTISLNDWVDVWINERMNGSMTGSMHK